MARLSVIPEGSIIADGFGRVDYSDAFGVSKATDDSIGEITSAIFDVPGWVKGLMKIRDSVTSIFGLKSGKELRPEGTTYFGMVLQNENEIVMGESDKHLDFRTSVFADRANEVIYLTTIVRFHNIWGRVYFFFVKPFHKMIIKSLLKREL